MQLGCNPVPQAYMHLAHLIAFNIQSAEIDCLISIDVAFVAVFYIPVNIPLEGIRLLDAVLGKKTLCAFCSGVVSSWCRLLRKSDV